MLVTTEIKVYNEVIPISQLGKFSHKRVSVRCDNCLTDGEIKFNDYNRITNGNNFYYCKNCKWIKFKATCKEKYGFENPMVSDTIKNRYKESIIEKYGVDNISKSEDIKSKKRQTTYENYGVSVPAKSNVVKDRMKKSCQFKYGYDWYMESEDFKNKAKEFCLINYGVDNPFKSDVVKIKIKNSLIRKYGKDHPMRVEEIFNRQKINSLRFKRHMGILYQGSYELDFIEFCFSRSINIEKGPSISYVDGTYYPDFFIRERNLIVEIKSSYTLQKEYDKNIRKKNQCIEDGYRFLFIVDKDYQEFIRELDLSH